MNRSLQSALSIAYTYLTNFAKSTDFWQDFEVAFGNNYDETIALNIKNSLANKGFAIPEIVIVDSQILGTAQGAYATQNNTIYLSKDFLEQNDSQRVAATIIEEIGHAIDVQINTRDSAGDEGQIFSRLVTGDTLTTAQLASLKAEIDRALITVGGQQLSVEQANITGTDDDDTLYGTDGNDIINAGAGDDRIYGMGGTDTINGGDGIDAITLDLGTSTTDTTVSFNTTTGAVVVSGTTFATTTTGIEHFGGYYATSGLTTGSGNDSITDGTYDDIIDSGAGDDVIISGAGNDVIISGAGNDIIGSGAGDDRIRAGTGDDTIVATIGGDDSRTIDGGAGNDLLHLFGSGGGTYLETTLTDNGVNGYSGSIAVEASGYNFTVSNVNFTSIERFNITGDEGYDNLIGGKNDDILDGGTGGGNKIYGHAGNDILISGNGNYLDTIDGGEGDDTIAVGWGYKNVHGGAGNDLLIIDDSQDTQYHPTVSFIDNGVNGYSGDRGFLSLSFDGIERFKITVDGRGGTIYGGKNNDILTGGVGDDTIDGGAGDDTLDGGGGTDSINGGAGIDAIAINLSESTTDTTVSFDTTTGAVVVSGTTFTTTTTNIESFDHIDVDIHTWGLTTGSGNDSITGGIYDDTISSGAGDDIVDAGGGNNQISGGDGNDRIYGGSGNDILDGDEGDDTISSGAGNDTLNGLTGADTMIGGTGNDTYIVDNVGDIITESSTLATEIDTVESLVTYTIGANIEKLKLTGITAINGTGNALNNTLTGNTASNILNGLTGADTMIGGTGNDTYIVDNAGDIVTEGSTLATEIDTVESSVTYSLGANVEKLKLTGITAINGTGNALNNTLTGNTASNILNGLTGADTMIGGTGNDTYIVDNVGDIVTESSTLATEIDTVQSSVTHTLVLNVEKLTLTGTGNINGTGNALTNTIVGNTGSNILNGGAGKDTLSGGAGADTFVFQFGQSLISGVDRITDFTIGTDKIDLRTQTGLAMSAPTSFTRASNSTATTLSALMSQVFLDANGAFTGNQGLGVNSAALVQVTSGGIAGTYLAINDSTAGFQTGSDTLVNITGYTGTLPGLGAIPVSSWFA